MKQVQSFRDWKSNPSISISPVSSSTINEAVGEGVIEDEDIFPLLRFSGAGISMRGLLLGTPGGKITFRSRLSLSRFFSVSRPLTLLPEAVVISWGLGIGILMGRPAFLWRIDSSNKDFSCTSDSLDFECSSLNALTNRGSNSTIAILIQFH